MLQLISIFQREKLLYQIYFSYCFKTLIELNNLNLKHLNIGSEIEEYINKSNYSEQGFIFKNYSPGGPDNILVQKKMQKN